MNRDSIDWEKTDVSTLFRKMFVPTLLGMLLYATINIADGCFVGRGAGSDALAAVNIVAPFFLLTTGIGLMFGCGVSITAAVHLAQGNVKAARIHVTQAFLVSLLLMVALSTVVMLSPTETARLMGCSPRLLPYVLDYMRWVIPSLPSGMLMSIGLFVVRLDGSPQYAMLCNVVPGLLNFVLDYLFVFPFGMGIEGAALATGLAQVVGSLLVIGYLFLWRKTLSLYPLKLSKKSLRLTLRNTTEQMRLGAPSMVGELAIACMMFTGNYQFLSYLGEEGVAAFSVACYCFPLVFMFGNAIAQSSQPILSYNHGAGLTLRVRETLRLSLRTAAVCGMGATLCGTVAGGWVVRIFLAPTMRAYALAVEGLPLFSLSFVLFAVNLVCIGYFQSMERFAKATLLMLLRGAVFLIPLFFLLPSVLGPTGLWLSVPASELLTLLFLLSSRWRALRTLLFERNN